jgi:hypothetical protein
MIDQIIIDQITLISQSHPNKRDLKEGNFSALRSGIGPTRLDVLGGSDEIVSSLGGSKIAHPGIARLNLVQLFPAGDSFN